MSFSCYRRNFFERRTQSRMIRLGLESFKEYYDYVNANPDEINNFMINFTVNYTNFFRNPEVFERVKQIIISCLEKKNFVLKDNVDIRSLSIYNKICEDQKLEIWSCPCATGEEPYSIAMLLDHLSNNYRSLPDYEIIASDIDNNALKKAKKGIYRSDSLLEIKNFYKKYFKEKSHKITPKYVIDDNLKKWIKFIEEDITSGHKYSSKYDIIFCRYLFIYISRSYRENLIKVLENHLARGGLLILGKTESLFYSQTKLKLLDKDARIYVKL